MMNEESAINTAATSTGITHHLDDPASLDGGEAITALQTRLLDWYAANRRDLPWRRTRDPYHILVAEMMLQQTQVPRVLPRYLAWLERFPTLEALAAAPTADVLREWSGLGYNSRAVRLQQIARHGVARHGGRLPETVEELLILPGIGDYTARAIACFAYEQDVPVLDTNVKRVLHRVLIGPEVPTPAVNDRQLWALAARAAPTGRGYDWNQALMDFGSSVCAARKPACVICPLRPICRAAPTIHALLATRSHARRANGATPATPFTSTNRYYRGQTLRVLGTLNGNESIALDALGPRVKPDYSAADRQWLYQLVRQLDREGLVKVWSSPATEPATAAMVRETSTTYALGAGVSDPRPDTAQNDDNLSIVRVRLPEG